MRILMAAICWIAVGVAQTVEGTVSDAQTGTPLSGATVTIQAGEKTAGTATTDDRGAFRIGGLPPGQYTASFDKRGFQGPGRDDAARKPFLLTSGGTSVKLEARMTPLAKVSGRVLARAAPVAGAFVRLLVPNMGSDATTDSQGRFTIENIPPGAYWLWAQPPRSLPAPPDRGGERMAWVNTFHPGVREAKAASRLVMRAGTELWDQEIQLLAEKVHRIRGTVLDERGVPAPRTRVTLGSGTYISIISMKPGDREWYTTTADDGSFEFPAVHDGYWWLSAEAEKDGAKLQAYTSLTMAGHDLDRLQLRLSPPFSVSGTVVWERSPAVPAPKNPVLVLLIPAGSFRSFLQSKPLAEGRFQIDSVFPGRYIVRTTSPDGFYLSSISMGSREVLNEEFDVNSGALPLNVFYKSNGGGVRGAVENCGSATVVLYPQDPNLQTAEFIRQAPCKDRNRFEIANLRPGDYHAFAFDRAPGLPERLFGFGLEPGLVNQAVNLSVRPNEFTWVDLKVISRP